MMQTKGPHSTWETFPSKIKQSLEFTSNKFRQVAKIVEHCTQPYCCLRHCNQGDVNKASRKTKPH